ncbi:DUF3263 domain-containing protein [Agrococcus beijingensis]|uniref:DUF3263 domain-containing protein n=1 Tax=Agrococcus beijingensis TaxID=3068634 RepID=UPI002741C6A9|nr:DUF3263 domain-containing protein [Agrococcus sp. REN33]
MPSQPRPRSTADAAPAADDAALAFAAAGSSTEALPAAPQTTDAVGHDLAAAREERIRRVLDFEAGWSSHGGAKARAIRAEFGWSTTRYYQVLDGLLEAPAAVRHDPMLVRRLLRLREAR